MDLTHFTYDLDSDGIATVLMDRAGEAMNTLGPVVAPDLEAIIERLETDPSVRAVVFGSGKPDNFCAGADIRWFETVEDPAEAAALIGGLQEAFNRIEALHEQRGIPVVAAIHGPALGGGLEFALACQARVCSTDERRTQLGQPEVQIGLIPAAGGCQRLPRVVGIQAALEMILVGRPVRPTKALRMGLADQITAPDQVVAAARKLALNLMSPAPEASPSVTDRLKGYLNIKAMQKLALEENPAGRMVLFSQAEKKMLAETKGNYPAPPAALRAIRTGIDDGLQAGLEVERDEFARLIVSPESRALRSIFFATQAMKRDSGVDSDAEARPVAKVGILGGGLMGGGIAAVNTTRAKVKSVVKEVDEAGIERGLGYVEKVLQKQVDRRRLSRADAWQAKQSVKGTTSYDDLADVDLVIEAVFEDLELKRTVLKDTESATGAETIFASNTSSLPIGDIAAAASRPENVIGMHYFSPVEKMPLLEVIVTPQTADWVTATAVAFGKKQGKTVIVVNDGTGFYTTRVIAPYTGEAMFLLQDGATIDEIDKAMVKWGFPVGPITLSDEVGIDVGAKIAKILEKAFGERMAGPPGFEALAGDDRKGRKNGRGFYTYTDGKKGDPDETVYATLGIQPQPGKVSSAEIQDRLSLAFINEAARCLDENILRSARDGDIGAVMGLGFPPFRGGPFHWVDHVGVGTVVDKLDSLATSLGPRFEAAPVLREMAHTGARFHS